MKIEQPTAHFTAHGLDHVSKIQPNKNQKRFCLAPKHAKPPENEANPTLNQNSFPKFGAALRLMKVWKTDATQKFNQKGSQKIVQT